MGRLDSVSHVLSTPLRLAERLRGRRRIALLAAYGLIVGAAALLAWRQSSLRGLPDIGDPFDVAAFTARDVADSDNAWIDYLRALEALDDRVLSGLTEDLRAARTADWAVVSPALKAWCARNRPALELWRRGSDKPAARPPWLDQAGDPYATWAPRSENLQHFNFLALIEAARRREEGDFDGAWTWYRALLRNGLLQQRRNGEFARLCGMGNVTFASQGIEVWAKDPRNDATSIRRALADVREAEALIVPNSETLKAEYLQLMKRLDDPSWVRTRLRGQDPMTTGWGGIEDQWYRHLPGYLEASWWLRREPERSRRAARIAYANWLAHCDGPTSFHPPESATYPGLFMTDPKSITMAYAYPPELHDWIESSRLWQLAALDQPRATDDFAGRQQARLTTIIGVLEREVAGRE